MFGQNINRFDKNDLIKQMLILGCEKCNVDFYSTYYCIKYDSICSKNFEKLSDPENIAVLAWDNVRPLESRLRMKFENFNFLDSFSNYFEFIDTIPLQLYFKDISKNEYIGSIMPKFSMQFGVNLKKNAYDHLDKILFDQEDMFIIANLSRLLSIREFYEGEWYLEGDKLYINIRGKKASAREYFEKNGDIKKVKWNKFMTGEK